MYNRQLDTFMRVYETGSFSSAAESLFVTPSAVIQQINSLENELGVSVFVRTRRGVTPTDAGRYLYSESIDYIRKGHDIQKKLVSIANGHQTVHIGTSPDYKIRLLYNLWVLYSGKVKSFDIRLTNMEADGSNAAEADIIEGIKTRMQWQGHMEFLRICNVPIGIAVSTHHPLYRKNSLTVQDIRPYKLLVASQVVPADPEKLKRILDDNGVAYESVPSYAPGVIWDSSVENNILLTPLCWADSLYDVKVIPMDWDCHLEYGLFYHRHAQEYIMDFINYIKGIYDGSIECEAVPVF